MHTAAEIFRFDVMCDPAVHVLGSTTTRTQRTGLVVHRFRVVDPTIQVAGRPVVEAARTAVRIAGGCARAGLALAVLDAALRSRAVRDRSALADAAGVQISGIGQVRRLIPLADARAESVPESELRLLIIESGLPSPEPQFRIYLPGGGSR